MATAKVNLGYQVWLDIKRYGLSYMLLIAVVASAFAVIYFTHLHRQNTNELELLMTQKDKLDIEWRNLLLEQNSLAEHSVIEGKAKKLLNMKRPTPETEIVIKQ